MTDFTGKSVIITGASRGIGAAAARAFAAAGAHVALAARSVDAIRDIAQDITNAGGSATYHPCDVARWDEVQSLFAATLSTSGTPDLLINNAGLIDPIARLADSTPADWSKVMDVNINGVYHGLRAALPHMEEAGKGTIINISSGAATSALEGWSHYCASKAAVLSLTRCADVEYRSAGLRIMGLSPGTVATQMQEQIRASGINPVSKLPTDGHIPAEWVAQALLWLAGPGGDDWCGRDFSLKTPEGRSLTGLPPLDS